MPSYFLRTIAYRERRGNDTQPEESHLRAVKEVTGYHIQARDGDGHLDDLLVDEMSWNLCHLVVDTRNWRPGSQPGSARLGYFFGLGTRHSEREPHY
jgi:hypothetical protein